ncbi:MAG: hypothetical protein LBG48_03425 [Rickettsiales bacterium]|nr:hypothetical protein [Rickettsiales bacterium]
MEEAISKKWLFQEIKDIDCTVFNYLLCELHRLKFDYDRRSFQEIRNFLYNQPMFSAEDFAFECFYVICVAGFKQDYAKAICDRIIDFIEKTGNDFEERELLTIYKNKNKVKSIKNIWDNRQEYQKKLYGLETLDEKIDFLGSLPFVGNITKYHLARNLGLDFAKYDIWIQRLAVALSGDSKFIDCINNSKIDLKVKYLCDKMFQDIQQRTGEKIGFIDVVLWRSCQKGLLKINGIQVLLKGMTI